MTDRGERGDRGERRERNIFREIERERTSYGEE